MDPERGIATFPHTFKECRTDMNVVRYYAPSKNLDSVLVYFVTERGWLLLCLKGLHF